MSEHTSVRAMLPRDVPLGGPRAMRVRRTLPARDRSLIGAGASWTTTAPTTWPPRAA